MTDRIQIVLAKPTLNIVRKINEHKVNRVKPLQPELNHAKNKISKLEDKKKKYLAMYEIDQIDRLSSPMRSDK